MTPQQYVFDPIIPPKEESFKTMHIRMIDKCKVTIYETCTIKRTGVKKNEENFKMVCPTFKGFIALSRYI